MFFKKVIKRIPDDGKRVILVIGGSGVLGKAFCAAQKEETLIVNVSRKNIVTGKNVVNYTFDVTKPPTPLFNHLKELLPRVDVLINMAYTTAFSTIENFEEQSFLKEMYIDVGVPIVFAKQCTEFFWKSSSAQENRHLRRTVINVSSGAGFGKTSRPELATYSAAKSALNVITTYLHDYLSYFGVSAHIVAPDTLFDEKILTQTVEELWKLSLNGGSVHRVVRI
jgi:NAD(P)-dependent dehydrogenase (short-subunit alcohol dehydrogenase family)